MPPKDPEPAATSQVAYSQRAASFQAPMVVSEIAENCLYSGLFGRLDSARMKAVTDAMLTAVETYRCENIIIDLSNIDLIDSLVAGHLFRVGDTLLLTGVRPIFCGISPVVAQTMVNTGIQFDRYQVARNLRSALTALHRSREAAD